MLMLAYSTACAGYMGAPAVPAGQNYAEASWSGQGGKLPLVGRGGYVIRIRRNVSFEPDDFAASSEGSLRQQRHRTASTGTIAPRERHGVEAVAPVGKLTHLA
jgi:hypothetical protein